MANQGVPLGGQFPARSELGPLAPFVDNLNALGANQGTQKFDALSSAFASATGENYVNTYENHPMAEAAPSGFTNNMVVLTDIPTSSTNYGRPRTLAAGYDPASSTMTVVFRDGTFYNYYQVSPGEWANFSASFSKGKPWLNKGFDNGKQKMDGLFIGKPRGVADVSTIDPQLYDKLTSVARAQQLHKQARANKRDVAAVKSGRTKLPVRRYGAGKNPFPRMTGY